MYSNFPNLNYNLSDYYPVRIHVVSRKESTYITFPISYYFDLLKIAILNQYPPADGQDKRTEREKIKVFWYDKKVMKVIPICNEEDWNVYLGEYFKSTQKIQFTLLVKLDDVQIEELQNNDFVEAAMLHGYEGYSEQG